ncbi:hypothetical protein PanWU01x14_152350 [Parasponia andersonii]|uniref:Uncharacterized protein n=1 Tax=Parasponia andersonii TaxID=3476 RepID=A0A2P5CHE8_PARAD|nr:hypothetical protein PanWU01x14_152350 [Parasponia andersonii]
MKTMIRIQRRIGPAIQRPFRQRSIEDWDDKSLRFGMGLDVENQSSQAAFGSDDVPVDETVKRNVSKLASVEDALPLMLGGSSVSPLRKGWGD